MIHGLIGVGEFDFQGAADVDGNERVLTADPHHAGALSQGRDIGRGPSGEVEHPFARPGIIGFLLLVEQDRSAFFEHGDSR
ncbi:MAG: hypothetical protein M3021_01250 [Actinomycetota bacterium]|nr:hypothetical protein [Actinomycetota bacterium]